MKIPNSSKYTKGYVPNVVVKKNEDTKEHTIIISGWYSDEHLTVHTTETNMFNIISSILKIENSRAFNMTVFCYEGYYDKDSSIPKNNMIASYSPIEDQ